MSKPRVDDERARARGAPGPGGYASVIRILQRHDLIREPVLGERREWRERRALRRAIHARMAELQQRRYRDFAAYLGQNVGEAELLAGRRASPGTSGLRRRLQLPDLASSSSPGQVEEGKRSAGDARSRGWLRELFVRSPAAYVIVDHNGTVRAINPVACKLLHSPGAALQYRGLARVFVREDRKRFDALVRGFADSAGRSAMVLGLRHPPSRSLVRVTLSGNRDDDRVLVSLRRVAGEQATTLRQRIAQEKAARARLEDDNRAKDQFLAIVSHDLRGPISSVIGWAQLLRRGAVDPGASDAALATIERTALTQLDLVEQLLDVTRIGAAKLVLRREPVDLAILARGCIDAIVPACAEKGVAIKLAAHGSTCVTVGDVRRLQQVAMNLLTNALKFTSRGGSIDVVLQCGEDVVRFSVCDTGCGLSAELLPVVFDCFRQGSASPAPLDGGLGLGLYIARHIVELHEGKITAESKGEGLGSLFTVTLPKSDTTVAASAPRPEPEPGGVHVLSVEDGVRVTE